MSEPTHGDIFRELGSVNAKLDFLIEHRCDHEKRLRSLERFRTWTKGCGAAIMALGGSAVAAAHFIKSGGQVS